MLWLIIFLFFTSIGSILCNPGYTKTNFFTWKWCFSGTCWENMSVSTIGSAETFIGWWGNCGKEENESYLGGAYVNFSAYLNSGGREPVWGPAWCGWEEGTCLSIGSLDDSGTPSRLLPSNGFPFWEKPPKEAYPLGLAECSNLPPTHVSRVRADWSARG